MNQSTEIAEAVSLLKRAKVTLHLNHLDAPEHALIVPRKLAVNDSSGEFVVALAWFRSRSTLWRGAGVV